MRRTIEDRKQELIIGLKAARIGLLDSIALLPIERLDEVFLGEWSVKDLLAHLVGWDFTNLQAIRDILSGRPPVFFRYYDQDWRSFNKILVEKYKIEPFSALLAEAQASHQELVSFLEALSAEELVNGKTRSESGRTVSIRNLLQAETRDEQTHAMQVRAMISQP